MTAGPQQPVSAAAARRAAVEVQKKAYVSHGTLGGAPPASRQLTDEYVVGRVLGVGSSSEVRVCSKASTGGEFAVKMVDRITTPTEKAVREAEILGRLVHPNVLRLHAVFHDLCFVCLVIDKYKGGDLVDGLQRHLNSRGLLDELCGARLAQQMCASIQYLHSMNVVHRDIKGDNYLLDREDITDPGCRLVLADFGAAAHCGPGERLHDQVGTRMFWAPEVYDKDYGAKVDVWALGVLVYGLLTSRFPFGCELRVRGSQARFPEFIQPLCRDFLAQLLGKREEVRPSSEAAYRHAWLRIGEEARPGACDPTTPQPPLRKSSTTPQGAPPRGHPTRAACPGPDSSGRREPRSALKGSGSRSLQRLPTL